MPIRIKQLLILEELVIITLGFDATLDCSYDGKNWTKEIDEKWKQIHRDFNKPTMYCYDKNGELRWEFKIKGFVNVSKIDSEIVKNDIRIMNWLNNNPNKNYFVALHDDCLIINSLNGEIMTKFEIR